ncbi:MAG: ATP-dependent zinc protease [Thiohalorhabdus sp.]
MKALEKRLLKEHHQQEKAAKTERRRARQVQARIAATREHLVAIDEELTRQGARLHRVEAVLEAVHGPNPGSEDSKSPEMVELDQAAGPHLITLGRIEWVGFPTLDFALKARIDSGAETASLSAKGIQEFEREGEDWIRFRLALSEEEHDFPERAKDRKIEAPIVRRVRIIQASGTSSRPVIRLPVRVGPITQQAEFTLEERTRLSYPVLLGRDFIRDLAVIDVSRELIHGRPEYPGPAREESGEEDAS